MDVTLIRANTLLGDLAAFEFTVPPGLRWTAGQSLRLQIPGAYGPVEHRFSIASIPAEKCLRVVTHLSGSSYKRALLRLQPGERAQVFAVEGGFVWQNDEPLAPDAGPPRRIFVAGGVGITPFYAIIRQRLHDQAGLPVTLLYSAADDSLLYRDFFDDVQQTHPAFQAHYFPGQRLTAAIAAKHLHSGMERVYIAGPSVMVQEISDGLLADGLPEHRLMQDRYTGRLPHAG